MESSLATTVINTPLIIEALNWRYATKIFDRSLKVPDEQMAALTEVLRLSPSSIGLQPWKFIVIRDEKIRKQIQEYSLGQVQITDAPHLLLICSFNDMDVQHIDKLIACDKTASQNEHSAYEDFRPYAISYINGMSREQLKEWMAEQAYIALGFLLSACAMLRIDACPMEAFDREKTNQLHHF